MTDAHPVPRHAVICTVGRSPEDCCDRDAVTDLARSRPCGCHHGPAPVCAGHAEAMVGPAAGPSPCRECGVVSTITLAPMVRGSLVERP